MKILPIFFEKREIVVPGDLLAEGDYIAGENTFREGKYIYATRVGLIEYTNEKVNVVALKAFYIPRIGDLVIGKIVEVGISGWVVDINSPYMALLRASDVIERGFNPRKDDLTAIYDVGDMIIAKIIAYDRTQNPLLTVNETGLGKITRGQIIKITPTKIPRVIGRKGSMINVIKKESGCNIILGQNGLILIRGRSSENERLAVMAIRKIEEESHTSGLTDRVAEMLRKEKESGKYESKSS